MLYCFCFLWHFVCVLIVTVTTRSCPLATTPNDTPRTTTTPLAAIQLPVLPTACSASSKNESSRQTGDGGCGPSAGHCRTDDQTAADQKQTPHLLPADNFGLFFLQLCCHCQVCNIDLYRELSH